MSYVQLGSRAVLVVEEQLPSGWWGAYDHHSDTIILQPGLGTLQRQSTLAHEAAHATLGHHGHHPSQEEQAEELAASWLIRHRDFEVATRIHDRLQAVAHELEVLPRDIKAYLRHLDSPRPLPRHLHPAPGIGNEPSSPGTSTPGEGKEDVRTASPQRHICLDNRPG
ncbi:ImmA/IrrE family metallo-endopeptidase [Arthrobacter rhombi]|uniref:ImmA/IrrE family metallo-endopeptidase n=1 Tax=Arthrobacter rhombi TaxID=71253 RepID=UPI003FCF1DE9